jgi:hypothetical protein
MADETKLEDIEEIEDSQSLVEIEIFFDMAMKLEEMKFNLYPTESHEMQRTLIDLIKQRLEFFKFEDDE